MPIDPWLLLIMAFSVACWEAGKWTVRRWRGQGEPMERCLPGAKE